MAGIEIKGFEDLRRTTEHLEKVVVEEAIIAAEDAAAKVIQQAVESSAPVRTGRLKSSVRVFEGIDRKALSGTNRRRLLVGPEKRKGFYGYFYEAGRRGQPARPWFSAAAASVEQQAREAGIAAFEAAVNAALNRMK